MVTHFTYGSDHLGGRGHKKYTTIKGVDPDMARRIQDVLHGYQWSCEYADDTRFEEMVERHGLRCVEKVTVWRYDRQVGIMNSKLDTQQ